ncbi:MAG: thiol-disulfide isomerase [Bryobacteraceae bacterium]
MSWQKLAVLGCIGATIITAAPAAVEFHKDIEPLLQAHCQTCHRPGEIGPMPLLTYAQTRPWAKSIRQAVLTGKMPPWFADNSVQHYSNDASLSTAEIETIKNWVDAGAPEGDPKFAPAARAFLDGWNIGQPDMVVEMPAAYQIPARGTVEYTYIIIPTNFKEDVWVQRMEVRPSDRAHVHHIVLYERQAGSKWLREYPVGVPFVPAPREGTEGRSSDGDRTIEGSLADQWLVGYAPGTQPYSLPDGTAFRIKAGSDFVLQVHYTTNGTPSADRSRIGLVFSKTPPTKRAFIANVADARFAIPPGDPNYSAKAEYTLASEVQVLAVAPHMHLRGKAMDMRAIYPTGESETLFHVPHYDFNWQINYYFPTPKTLPRGTKLEVTGTWDNSANNRFNPDPKAEVHWGDQSWDEMLLGVTMLQIPPDADLDKLFQAPKRDVAEAKP